MVAEKSLSWGSITQGAICAIMQHADTQDVVVIDYCIPGNFRAREKVSRFCGYSQKFSPQNLAPLALQKRAICESFLRENRVFHQFAKVFSLESFPLFGKSKHSLACI